MVTFNIHCPFKKSRFTFDYFVKVHTYTYLNFVPIKNSPEKLKMNISVFEKDNTLIEEYNYILQLDETKENYQDHYVGFVHDGTVNKVIFTALNPDNNSPIENLSIGMAVVKIKDGDEDAGMKNPHKPRRPRNPKNPSFSSNYLT